MVWEPPGHVVIEEDQEPRHVDASLSVNTPTLTTLEETGGSLPRQVSGENSKDPPASAAGLLAEKQPSGKVGPSNGLAQAKAPTLTGMPTTMPSGPSPILHHLSFEDEIRSEFEMVHRKLDTILAKKNVRGSKGALFHGVFKEDRSRPLHGLDGELGVATASSLASFQAPITEILTRGPHPGEVQALRHAGHGASSHSNSHITGNHSYHAPAISESPEENRNSIEAVENSGNYIDVQPQIGHNTSSATDRRYSGGMVSSVDGRGSAGTTNYSRRQSKDNSPLPPGLAGLHHGSFQSLQAAAVGAAGPGGRRGSILSNAQTRALRQKELEQLALLQNHQRQGALRCLDSVWNFLEYPESSKGAHILAKITPLYIVLTVGVTMIQCIDEEEVPLSGTTAAVVETIIDCFYMLEFLIRLASCPNKKIFFKSLFNWVDLLAALPLFIRASEGFILPVGRLDTPRRFILLGIVPIIRLLKTLRRFEKLQLLFDAFKVALEALPVLLFTLMTIAMVFSVMVYLAEPRHVIPHLPYSLWFTLVTMTTVGYGDVVPQTTAGCVVTSSLIIVTMLYLAVPLGIIGSAFDQTWNDRDRILLMQRTRERLHQWGYTASDIPVLFKLADSDDDGELHMEDFQNLLTRMQIGLSNERILALFQTFDRDGSGAVDSKEFVRALFPYSYHEIFTDGDEM
mmetsp:Transcript_3020/g.6710  ORF Transcript_3020/g.6710 Transcript_3020/m.6710 type:complete len:684 (+) Transcript_3020:112-2163(+)